MANSIRQFGALIKNQKFRNSFLKHFAGMASIALVSFVVYAIVSYSMYSMYLRNALSRFREQTLLQGNELVDLIFESIDQTMYLIENSERITQVLAAPASALPDASSGDGEGHLKWSDIAYARDSLFEATVLNPAIDSIYALSLENRHVVSWTDFRPIETFYDDSFEELHERGYAYYARPKRPEGVEADVITVMRSAEFEGKKIAVAVFNIKYDIFASRVSQGFESHPESICLADKGGSVFYATDKSNLNTDINSSPIYGESFAEASRSGSSTRFEGGKAILAIRSASGGYVTLSAMDASDVAAFQKDFVAFALWAGTIGLLAAFFLAIIISFGLHRNLIRLVLYFSGKDGNASPEADSEIRFITENITGFVPTARHIEQELAEKLAELKKAQAIALQNQINPHFILNTLQIVNLDILGRAKTDTDATRIISLLSEILKSNLNTTDYLVPLSYELRQASKYVEIERIRNKNDFAVDWDVDSSLNSYRTVKFIIQPVLENCFKHGIGSLPSGALSIRAEASGKTLVITIHDNGVGIPPETLADIKSRLQNSYIQENSHIGLCNVDKRIKLVFGDACGVSISSAPGLGTTVTIRQKLIRNDWKQG
ncbi:MAG: histidine kinase [Clostridiales bacterium]|nr:histidine kinase [Clostridiales bacterium]